eukprot:TRINITY_DN158_c0_g1_i1.p1 TRINITY_DN158_c0_g1~~TRINITY_DN158_c0_g1_i1.p1  ORF type:complete len:278 (-),score=49.40 TRINITY_DN158_c0_g1_i1:119-952(-)
MKLLSRNFVPKFLSRSYVDIAGGLFRNLPPLTYTTKTVGTLGQFDYRQFFFNEAGEKISPWHDIPYFASEDRSLVETGELVLNYVNECPRATREKMEMSKLEEWNPIWQDTKKGQLRYLKWSPILFNYGFVPQTWEDPKAINKVTKLGGDNDPLDVVDVGRRMVARGEVVRARILGALAMIDEGETDWKIIVCNIEDPKIRWIEDIDQLEEKKKGIHYAIREYFRNYKLPDGKPLNTFAFNEKFLPKEKALEVIQEHHEQWKTLFDKKPDKIWLKKS